MLFFLRDLRQVCERVAARLGGDPMDGFPSSHLPHPPHLTHTWPIQVILPSLRSRGGGRGGRGRASHSSILALAPIRQDQKSSHIPKGAGNA